MKEPDYLKLDLDLVEGLKGRIERRRKAGESYAAMYAENDILLGTFPDDVDQDFLPFQRAMAFHFAIMVAITDEYMKSQGWSVDKENYQWQPPKTVDIA